MQTEFDCSHCGKHKIHNDKFATGYGIRKAADESEQKVCFDCCGILDRETMLKDGVITLYVQKNYKVKASLGNSFDPSAFKYHVINWPGSLKFDATAYSTSKHRCFGGSTQRTDVWFVGPDLHVWHGVNIGDNELLRCKRTKQTVKATA